MKNKHPSAFINMIAEGKNFDECLKYLQETWDELQAVPKWRSACKAEARRGAGYLTRLNVAQSQVRELNQKLATVVATAKNRMEEIHNLRYEINDLKNRRD